MTGPTFAEVEWREKYGAPRTASTVIAAVAMRLTATATQATLSGIKVIHVLLHQISWYCVY